MKEDAARLRRRGHLRRGVLLQGPTGLHGYLAHKKPHPPLRTLPYEHRAYRGTSLIRNRTPPYEHHRALGMVLLQGPMGALFLLSEVPLLLPLSPPAGPLKRPARVYRA